uniref:Uncharacterized protein n=1 Tax=Hyaloperonospora arabidopsidis (strain Emoy2) TaxID=559515 RepID=M4BP01_HYAAE
MLGSSSCTDCDCFPLGWSEATNPAEVAEIIRQHRGTIFAIPNAHLVPWLLTQLHKTIFWTPYKVDCLLLSRNSLKKTYRLSACCYYSAPLFSRQHQRLTG